MTSNKNDELSLSEVAGILEKQISIGEILASCSICNQYLSLIEYKTCKCFVCNKKIKFKDILYYPGAKKDNN